MSVTSHEVHERAKAIGAMLTSDPNFVRGDVTGTLLTYVLAHLERQTELLEMLLKEARRS